jgi:hypothetical protein
MFALIDMSLKIFETQFQATNLETFLMDFSDYFASFLVSIFVAHFGGRGNRAKWVAAGSIVTALSSIAFIVLFFYYEIIKLAKVKGEFFLIYFHILSIFI